MLRENMPLVVVTVALTIAVFILFKEVRAAKDQAAIGARLASSLQQQEEEMIRQQQQLQQQQQQYLKSSEGAGATDEDEEEEAAVPKTKKTA